MKAALLLILSLSVAFACKNRPNLASGSALTANETMLKEDTGHFAEIFRKVLGERYKDSEVRQLLYAPSAVMYETFAAGDAEQFLARMDAAYRGLTPDDLFQAGQERRFSGAGLPDLRVLLKNRPVTIVFVPGVFGEFIKTMAMAEVLENRTSSYAQEVAAAFARARDEDAKMDKHFSVKELNEVAAPLDDLMKAASIDDADGKPLVKFISFIAPPMSMESLGANAAMSPKLLRRLDKFFRIVGVPERIVFMGYSRGAPLAMEMMEAGSKAPWFSKIRAMVSLGGDLYGADAADGMKAEGSELNVALTAANELIANLQEIDDSSLGEGAAIVAKNAALWADFIKKVARFDPELVKVAWETTKGVDPRSLIPLMRHVWDAMKLDHLVTDYSGNVRRFKFMVREVIIALEELTTAKRVEWWRTHVIPTDGIRYYALGASMVDPDTAKMGRALATSPVSYDSESVDYRTLLAGYRKFRTLTGFAVNDSQMAIHKARFWPELNSLLNPNQKPIDAHFLGVLGTHHWALALRVVNETLTKDVNPFPRKDMLQAVAAKVVLDEQQK